MEVLFIKLLHMGIQASIAIGVVLIVRELFKLMKVPKKYAYILWVIPFIRLVCPIDIESPFSIMPDMTELNIAVSIENIQSEAEVSDEIMSEMSLTNDTASYQYANISENYVYTDDSVPVTEINDYTEHVNVSGEKADVQEESNFKINVKAVVSVVWMCIAVVICIYSFISLIILKKKLRVKVSISDDVYSTDYIDTAFVLGIVKPVIYVPSHINDKELEYVIAHEKYHIKRLDYVIKLIAYFIAVMHWYNPVIWLAYFLMERDMEMSCDEAVLRELGMENKIDYAEALLKISSPKHYAVSIPTAFSEGGTKDRVKNIVKIKKPLIIVLVIAVIVIVVLGVVLLTNPKKDDGETTNVATTTDANISETDKIFTELKAGKYFLKVEGAGGHIYDKTIPYIEIYEDGSISFNYYTLDLMNDRRSREYTITDNVLSFISDADGSIYAFEIQADNIIKFNGAASSELGEVDEEIIHKVSDGSLFVYEYIQNIEYDVPIVMSFESLEYKTALITDDDVLGADGVILDYADEDIVVFHGYAGLFVYDRKSFQIVGAVDLEEIGCNMTQGDNTCVITVSSDGEFVNIVPVGKYETFTYYDETSAYSKQCEEQVVYRYNIQYQSLQKCRQSEIADFEEFEGAFEGLLPTAQYVEGVENTQGFYSNSCVEVSDGVYGYLTCSTGLWKDICYVESDMVYMMYDEEYFKEIEEVQTLIGEMNAQIEEIESNVYAYMADNAEYSLKKEDGELSVIEGTSYYDKYKNIIDKYTIAKQEGWDTGTHKDEGLCYVFGYEGYDESGYYIYDIDNNGTKELLLGKNHENDDTYVIYCIYAINTSGEVIKVVDETSWHICEDSIIDSFNYNGASDIIYGYYDFNDAEVDIKECVFYRPGQDRDNPWFYSTTIGYYVPSEDIESITEDTAMEVMNKYKQIYVEFVPFE